MSFLAEVVRWFTDGEHLRGSAGVIHRLAEHVQLSAAATLTAIALALPVALVLGHVGRGGFVAINLSNVGRALPSFGVLVFVVQLTGIGTFPAYVALVALALPPIVTNTYVGVREVDESVRDAARGMGLSGSQVLWRVELPLAMPLVMVGIRSAAVAVVATATLAAVVGSGGLGRYIIDGIAQRDRVQVFAGALLVALLSLVTELLFAALQRRLSPPNTADERPGTLPSTLPGGFTSAGEAGSP